MTVHVLNRKEDKDRLLDVSRNHFSMLYLKRKGKIRKEEINKESKESR